MRGIGGYDVTVLMGPRGIKVDAFCPCDRFQVVGTLNSVLRSTIRASGLRTWGSGFGIS